MRAKVVVGWAGLLCCFGCTPPAKHEAASLVAAVERFHKADNADRPSRAGDVAGVSCKDPEVSSAKDACVKATKETAEAILRKQEVERGLVDLEKGKLTPADDAAKALPGKLDEAEQLLRQGHTDMPACDQKILALRARYDL